MNGTSYTKVGVFVLTGLALAFGAVLWVGAASFRTIKLPAVTYVDESVQGLEVGSAVKLRGAPIGQVSAILIAPDERRVEIHFELDADRVAALHSDRSESARDVQRRWESGGAKLVPELRMQLVPAGITGLRFLGADYFDVDANPLPELPFEPEGVYIPAVPSTLMGLEQAFSDMSRSIPPLIANVGVLVEHVDQIVAGFDAAALQADVHELLDSANEIMAGFAEEGFRADLQASADSARKILESFAAEDLGPQVETLMAQAQQTLDTFDQTARSLSDRDGPVMTLATDLDTAVTSMDARLEQADVPGTLRSLRTTSDELASLTRDVNDMSTELQSTLSSMRDAFAALADLASLLERDPTAPLVGKPDSGPSR